MNGKARLRFGAGLVVGVVTLGAIVAVGKDGGNPAQQGHLLSGQVWLASAHVGQLALLDGSSEEVVAQVEVASHFDNVDAVQDGMTAYAVNRSAGWIRRVDGATFQLSPPATPIPGAGDGLRVLASRDALYTLDIQRGALARTNPTTLDASDGVQPLATQIGPQAATVDRDGRLWVLDTTTGDLTWTNKEGQRGTRRNAAQPGQSMLVTANGVPVLVDLRARTATTLDPSTGAARKTLTLDLRANDKVQVSGSSHDPRLYVVASRGLLETCDLDNGTCGEAVPLSGQGNDFGAAVESGNRLFVPDYATGRVWIIDIKQRRVIGQASVLTPNSHFDLLTRDGIVFFNDPANDKAGVIRVDGSVGHIAKYDASNPAKGLTNGPPTSTDNPAAPANPNPPTNPNPPPDQPAQPGQPPQPGQPTQPTQPSQPVGPPPDQPTGQPPDPRNPTPSSQVRIVVSSPQPQVNQDVTVKAAAVSGPDPVSAHWTFGDGVEADQVIAGHRWANAQTYQISVQATFADGSTALASMPIQVVVPPAGKPTLTVTPPTNGSVNGSGITCPTTCTATFDLHQQVTLTAHPAAGFEFVKWGGACLGTDPTACQVTMDTDKTVSATFRVIPPPTASATASVNPSSHSGACGTFQFVFSGKISVDKGPVDVTYKWIRSDGAIAPVQTAHFTGTGAQQQWVTDGWTLSASYSGWEAIQILTPNAAVSNHANFTLTCTGPTASATASVTPASHTGPCGGGFTFTFSGTISVDRGPVDVTYKWIRSDGALAPTQTLHFAGSGPQQQAVANDTWTLVGQHPALWEAVQILTPNSAVSNHANISVNCTS